ncbi:YezD family protein [Novosphingobium sp. YJ-S2-02]|uniref:YezD family protein n=1 Tax=Novosphingobium aureum TaxID=2792964 RepID=A0A931HD23_9SPHN|nr:YezD family protein [Novosphingobium aureum]MBH0113189.1 YezD family protein [Novosphingobium aureum]
MTSSRNSRPATLDDAEKSLDLSLATVRTALSDLKFGSVSLTVHEGRVVQIDVTEKRRISSGH